MCGVSLGGLVSLTFEERGRRQSMSHTKPGKFMFNSCAIVVVCGTLTACGDTVTNQALLGGTAGVGVAVFASGSVLTGAAIGAGANVVYCRANPGKCN